MMPSSSVMPPSSTPPAVAIACAISCWICADMSPPSSRPVNDWISTGPFPITLVSVPVAVLASATDSLLVSSPRNPRAWVRPAIAGTSAFASDFWSAPVEVFSSAEYVCTSRSYWAATSPNALAVVLAAPPACSHLA